MLKRRIACALLILFAAILYFFDNETVTLALLIALIVMPAISMGFLAVSGRNLKVSMDKSPVVAENPVIRVRVENPDIIPVAGVEVEVKCANLRTGENDSQIIRCSPGPKGKKEVDLEVMPRHAGRYELSIASAKITDPLILRSRNIICEDRQYLTIMPEIFDMPLSYASDAAMLEGDRSSDSRRGNDPGEVRGIREYVPGDPVRNIHWKLSEKMDKMLVKELGNPITDQFLIIMDTESDISQDPVALEATASVFASVINALMADGVSISIAWTNPEDGGAVIRKIADEDDLAEAADEYLAVPASMPSAFSRIERDIAESRYAHIILVGSRMPVGIESIANGCQVTLLLYGAMGSISENNVTFIGFEAATYKSDLAGIEV